MWAKRVPEEKCCNQSDLNNFGEIWIPGKNYLDLGEGEKSGYMEADGLCILKEKFTPEIRIIFSMGLEIYLTRCGIKLKRKQGWIKYNSVFTVKTEQLVRRLLGGYMVKGSIAVKSEYTS